MTPNPDCPTCQGTNKVIVPEGKDRVTIGFFDYSAGSTCPRCARHSSLGDETSMIAQVSISHIEDRLARIERHLGLSIGDGDR